MAQKIIIDEKEYSTQSLNTETALLLEKVNDIDNNINEKRNMIALLTKAKKSYISELKSEMLSAKAGFNFSE